MTVKTTYKRRPEAPDHDDKRGLLELIVQWARYELERWGPGEYENGLQVVGLWGPRGSGKTSLMLKLLAALDELRNEPKIDLRLPALDPERKREHECTQGAGSRATQAERSYKPTRELLFEPEQLDDGTDDHLLSALLDFIKTRYLSGSGCERAEKVDNALQLLIEHAHLDRFLDYERDVAPSESALVAKYRERLGPHFYLSTELRERIQAAINGEQSRLVLFIDDLDLIPHRTYDLLRALHLYFRKIPLLVFVSGDRPLLIRHIAARLKKLHDSETPGLAEQIAAKYVPYQWELGDPPSDALDTILFEVSPGYFNLKTWWPDGTEALLSQAWRTHRRETHAQAQAEDGAPDDHAESVDDSPPPWSDPLADNAPDEKTKTRAAARYYLDRFGPTTWRGLKRVYNRLAETAERDDDEGPEHGRYLDPLARRLRYPLPLFRPLYSLVVALDERLPELGLHDEFQRSDHFGAWILSELERKGDPPAPPTDRLRPPWLEERRIREARQLLHEFHTVINYVRAGASVFIPDRFLAITAIRQADALEDSRALWQRDFALPRDRVDHLDYRGNIHGDRPTADEIRAVIAQLKLDFPHDPGRAHIFARAPLSLLAWLGWHTRYTKGADIGLIGQHPDTRAFQEYRVSEGIDRTIRSYQFTERYDLSLRDTGVENTEAKGAIVVLDIRPSPDHGRRAPPFLDEQGAAVRPERAVKLASDPGLSVTPENVAALIADVCFLLQGLDEQGLEPIHLGVACPGILAFLIGRQLHPFAPVHLYEYEGSTGVYRRVTTIG